jgi:hypothetical protein
LAEGRSLLVLCCPLLSSCRYRDPDKQVVGATLREKSDLPRPKADFLWQRLNLMGLLLKRRILADGLGDRVMLLAG